MHHHHIHTLKPHSLVRQHNLRIIRPLIYVRAAALAAFADSSDLPDFRHNAADGKPLEPPPAGPLGERLAEPLAAARALLAREERNNPDLFTSLKCALHPLMSAKNIEKDLKEHRHRKKSVIQMKNGAPVYDSDDGTDEEPVP